VLEYGVFVFGERVAAETEGSCRLISTSRGCGNTGMGIHGSDDAAVVRIVRGAGDNDLYARGVGERAAQVH
jgi:hypothetical protein